MFLIICLHGSRRADFLFFPLCRTGSRNLPLCIPRQGSRACLRANVPGVSRAFTAGNSPMIDHIACRPPSCGGQKENSTSPSEFSLSPLLRKRTARGGTPLSPPSARSARTERKAIIRGSSSRSRVRPRAPWAACRRTWRRSLRCSPHPLSRASCVVMSSPLRSMSSGRGT